MIGVGSSFTNCFVLINMKTKRKIIVIVSSLLLLALIGLAFAVTKHNKGEVFDDSRTTRSYVKHLYQTIPEVTSDFDYYTIARRQVGLTDKDKLIYDVLKILVCKLEVEGTEYDISAKKMKEYDEEINKYYRESLYMKNLVESKGLDYGEVIKSRGQSKFGFLLQICVMQKWENVDRDSINGGGATGQELLEQFNELQDKKIEQLHKESLIGNITLTGRLRSFLLRFSVKTTSTKSMTLGIAMQLRRITEKCRKKPS